MVVLDLGFLNIDVLTIMLSCRNNADFIRTWLLRERDALFYFEIRGDSVFYGTGGNPNARPTLCF